MCAPRPLKIASLSIFRPRERDQGIQEPPIWYLARAVKNSDKKSKNLKKVRCMKPTYIRSVKAQIAAVVTLLAFSFAIMVPTDAVAQTNPVQKASSSVLVTGQIAGGGVF